MAVKISTWVWHESGARGTDLLVLLALADNANDDGVCWPSLEYLASKTRLHSNTVRERLRSLRAQGIVSWDERPGRPNMFRIVTQTPIDFSTPTGTKNSTPTDSVPLQSGSTPPLQSRVYPTPTVQGVPEPSITINKPSGGRASAPSPFCSKHSPNGPDGKPCRGCGDARRVFDAARSAEKSKPSPRPFTVLPGAFCVDGKHRLLADGTCLLCEHREEAS